MLWLARQLLELQQPEDHTTYCFVSPQEVADSKPDPQLLGNAACAVTGIKSDAFPNYCCIQYY